jgi:outer membrane protein assembly factor BamA
MRKSSRGRLIGIGALALGLVTAAELHAQGVSSGGGGSVDRIEGNFKFLPIPYVNYDRSIGLQGGLLPMALFNPVPSDTLSPSSLAGAFGMYTTNDTWFVSVFAKVHLDEDNWRLSALWGTGTYNFQFYLDTPITGWIPYQTDVSIAAARVERRLYRRLYGGLSYVYLDFTTTLGEIPIPVERTLNGLGLMLSLDHRSSVYYPRSGFQTDAEYFSYPSWMGNEGLLGRETESSKLEFEYNHFVSTRSEQDVVAGRFFAGAGLGDLSFNQQFVVGQQKDIRGYTQGEFRGSYLLALQGEYRWNFHPRLGAVGFAGVATVFEAINKENDGKLLPGIGAGIRYTADTETHMNVGLDIAVGRGDWGVYFRLGELF